MAVHNKPRCKLEDNPKIQSDNCDLNLFNSTRLNGHWSDHEHDQSWAKKKTIMAAH